MIPARIYIVNPDEIVNPDGFGLDNRPTNSADDFTPAGRFGARVG